MARFADLPVEIQTDIWMLVLPFQGGIHWIEFEGYPLLPDLIKKTLRRVHDFFDDKELMCTADLTRIVHKNIELRDYYYENEANLRDSVEYVDNSSPFFQFLYPIVPSVWGRSGRPVSSKEGDILAPELLEEIANTRCCRQLSTYTQITTLLSICRISRLTVLNYLHKIDPALIGPLYRGVGPLSRPRPLSTWRQQYQNLESDHEYYLQYYTPPGPQLVPMISAALDLVVYRLHTSSGHPAPILYHSMYQLYPENFAGHQAIPAYCRIGIEWHSLWATPQGRKEFCAKAVGNVIKLAGPRLELTTALYWLVDGIPRPQWDQYPPGIPAAFSQLIERNKQRTLRRWPIEEAEKARLLKHYGLNQEFEANGRRYYVVFVVYKWLHKKEWGLIDDIFLDPAVSWDRPFPGGEDLWPEALRAPVRMVDEIGSGLGGVDGSTFILSWEPI